MPKILCTGVRKDGQPCQAHGLEQYNGLCLAHGAPPEQAHEWRARGGKNSATAVRRDNRMPEQLKHALDLVQDRMERLAQQEPTPANCNAISRCAQTLINLRRRADEEMELIRTEETQAAAAVLAGAHTDLDVLEAAARINAEQERYRSEALVEQGFADFEEPANPDDPPEVVLNNRGRRRFGYHNLFVTQELLIDMDRELAKYDFGLPSAPYLPAISGMLNGLEKGVEATLSELAQVNPAPVDPLTGQPFTKLPACVKVRDSHNLLTRCDENPQAVLSEQRTAIKELRRRVEELTESEDYERKREALEEDPHTLEKLETAFEVLAGETPQQPSAQIPEPADGEGEAGAAVRSSQQTARTRGRGRRRQAA